MKQPMNEQTSDDLVFRAPPVAVNDAIEEGRRLTQEYYDQINAMQGARMNQVDWSTLTPFVATEAIPSKPDAAHSSIIRDLSSVLTRLQALQESSPNWRNTVAFERIGDVLALLDFKV